ncbi:MAG: hypothetical protein M1282_05180 [Chloroflexi bacterium]|nr:hypothetical protein [Chloroflexota bacterium]
MDEKEYQAVREELKKLRRQIQNVNVKHKESLSTLERIAVRITDYVGSTGFFIIIFCWTISWFCWNTLAPKELLMGHLKFHKDLILARYHSDNYHPI